MNHGVQVKSNIIISSDIQFVNLFHVIDMSEELAMYIGLQGSSRGS